MPDSSPKSGGDAKKANRSTAAIYKEGGAASKCSICMANSLGNGIGFSHGESRSGTSYNENLTVEANDKSLFLRPIGFSMGVERDTKLSEEGAAEYYWSMLIVSLQ